MSEMMMRLSEAAAAVNGELAGEDRAFSAVSTDTRTIKAGDLFVALKGERFDGAGFAEKAIEAGAAGVMVNAGAQSNAAPAIHVEDTRIALGQLGAYWRKRFLIPIIAITGSNGKTTVKEMCAAILRAASNADGVLATEGNLNNDIGCPQMLLRLRETHAYAVLEMGMNHPGEIRYLTHLARPDVALVNNAQSAHIGLMGSVRAIAKAKGEIFEGLGEKGTAIINADDAHADYWRSLNTGRRVLSFGFSPGADVRGEYRAGEFGGTLHVVSAQGEASIDLQVPGEHNARNALAALACALALGVDLNAAATALARFTGVKGRLRRVPALHGGLFLDDTYNANPDSTRAALAVLARQRGRRYFVLGNMGELGEEGPAMHAQIGLAAREAGVERLFGLGQLAREAVNAFGAGGIYYERIEELLADVENALAPDVTVLVKGSRAMQMERVVKSLSEGEH
ncbi:MAG: UDP-N-acetylmuramoyl-tripeptide--D-alanyl-D-alanine ligase [Pseudomonadota bacterium]